MNRIVIIGNGFDLAHGLPTKYSDFINVYWKNVVIELKKLKLNEYFNDGIIKIKNPTKNNINNDFNSLIEAIRDRNIESEKFNNLRSRPNDLNEFDINYLNKFFEIINDINKYKNWVDIEEEYYTELIKIKNRESNKYKEIKDLNKDFTEIKNLLIEYLKSIDEQNIKRIDNDFNTKNKIGRKIYYPIKPNDLNSTGLNHLTKIIIKELEDNENVKGSYIVNHDYILKNINTENKENDIKKMLLRGDAINNFNLIPDNTLILSFNYTNTHSLYDNPREYDSLYYRNMFTNIKDIKIHGSIKSYDNNPIIFGYGDELDDEYRNIEKLKNNDYLENIKSIIYSETANYKNTIEFLESDYYQIFIMGHSCGTSDRTLLNTMFEHDNCTSIKVFFHEINENKNNFSDLVRNISRNFNDKIKMRDRLVNKSFSEPL